MEMQLRHYVADLVLFMGGNQGEVEKALGLSTNTLSSLRTLKQLEWAIDKETINTIMEHYEVYVKGKESYYQWNVEPAQIEVEVVDNSSNCQNIPKTLNGLSLDKIVYSRGGS
jgi:hypothetical protein